MEKIHKEIVRRYFEGGDNTEINISAELGYPIHIVRKALHCHFEGLSNNFK